MRGERVLAVVVGVLLSAGCASTATTSIPTTTASRPVGFVVVGGDQALALVRRDDLPNSWPQLVFRDAFPLDAVYVNLSALAFSVVGAAAELAPSFAELQPDVVAIWAGQADSAAGRAIDDFRRGLDDIVTVATRRPNTVVLLATLPDGPPAYNDAIRAIASERSARLVDLVGVVPPGTTELDAAQNRAVAEAFIGAYRAS